MPVAIAPDAGSPLCATWCDTEDIPGPVLDKVTDAAILDDAIRMASSVLYALSARRWRGSGCITTVRILAAVPGCERPEGWDPSWGWWAGWGTFTPSVADLAVNRLCACETHPDTVTLPDYPVAVVHEVRIRGTLLDPTTYRLNSGRVLERLSGGSWPTCGDGMEVVYSHGQDPPDGGRLATGALAGQIALWLAGSKDCKLPERVTSISRQGVTMTVLDPADFLDKGRTGIAPVDLWLTAVNPDGHRSPPSVWSPDTAPTVQHRQRLT
jgi:hypothetical protein